MNWESIQQFFRENPRAWLIGVAAVGVLFVSVWGIWGGFSLQFSNFFAADLNPSASTQSCGSLGGVICTARDAGGCGAGYSDVGQKTTDCDSGYGFCCKSATATTTPAASTCGPSIPAGGTFDWSLDKNENWDINCVEGQSNINPQEPFYIGVNVKTCHPNNLHLVWRADYRNKSSCDMKMAPDRQLSEGAGITTRVASNVTNMDWPNGAGGTAVMTYDSAYAKCGSVHLWSAFWSDGSPVNAGNTGYHVVLNYGKDCGTVTPTVVPTTTPAPGTTTTPLPGTSATPVMSAVPTLSGTPVISTTPVSPLLQCAPINQTVALNQVATVTAVGGNGVYQWSLSGSGIQESGTANSIGVSYTVAGQKVVRVSSAGQSAACTVNAGSSPAQQSTLTITKGGFIGGGAFAGEFPAITVNPGEIAQFNISITNNGTKAMKSITVVDTLPGGMSYRPGSTTIDKQSVMADAITTSGVVIDNLDAGSSVTVSWAAVADATQTLSAGPHQFQPRVVARSPGFADISADMSVTVYGGGAAGGTTGTGVTGTGATGAGGVSTGPGDAVTIALVMAAGLTLLYSGYTRSASYRRHEVDAVSRDQGPMDFRS
jgi:uncharacterized repeat protein (TIGR01451 family)